MADLSSSSIPCYPFSWLPLAPTTRTVHDAHHPSAGVLGTGNAFSFPDFSFSTSG